MKMELEFEDYEVDSDLPTDNLLELRDELIDRGYKLYYEPENDEHYWINRPLSAWESKDFILINGEELLHFLRAK